MISDVSRMEWMDGWIDGRMEGWMDELVICVSALFIFLKNVLY